MKFWRFFSIITIITIGMTSCQESDDTPEEYPDWKNTNEQAFLAIYNEAKAAIATGDKSWAIYPSCFESVVGEDDYTVDECIVMQKVIEGDGALAPFYTDTVAIHYAGRLQPSTNYENGLRFDASYYGDKYDDDVSTPYTGAVSNFIEGFSTALQHMHRGDAYIVYIPYTLGYGSSGNSNIPGYSMLTFELILADFWHKEKGDREDIE